MADYKIACPRCGKALSDMQACHLICENCGLQLDCSDKGWIW